jgi:hypothetical protein
VLALAIVYGGYFWFVRRVVVGPSEVLILLKKDGNRSLPGDEVIVPRMPDAKTEPDRYKAWKERYGDCNGIMEEVYPAGTYFKFSPFDYEREVIDVSTSAARAERQGRDRHQEIRAAAGRGQILADPRATSAARCRSSCGPGATTSTPTSTPTRSSRSSRSASTRGTAAWSR